MTIPTMRNTLTLLALASACATTAQVNNGGFESWTTTDLFEVPAAWETGNGRDGNGLVTTTKVTVMAPSGNAAVHMETIAAQNDTAFGFILHGAIDENPSGGVLWSTEIQTIAGFARYDVQPGDTAVLIFVGWSGGNIVGQDTIAFVGSQPNWALFSHSLIMGPITPDSVLVGAASSNAISEIGITPGSWLELDAIALTSTNVPNPDQLPNHDFEDWLDVTSEDPDGWSSFNPSIAGIGLTSVVKSTDANSGAFSAMVSTLAYDGDTLVGILTNGMIDQQGPSGGAPFAAHPTLFTGAYKYLPSGQDTGHVAVLFYANGSLVGVSGVEFDQTMNTWTPFSSPLFVISTPDTMSIIVYAGNNAGSMLYIDDLEVSGGDVGVEEIGTKRFSIFPNPAQDRVTLVTTSDLGNATLTITDLSGRVVQQSVMKCDRGAPKVVDISMLPSGTYLVELITPDQRSRERLVKQ